MMRNYEATSFEQNAKAMADQSKIERFFPAVDAFEKRLGKFVSVLRRKRRFSQAVLADRACTSVATIQRIERGDGSVSFATLLRVLTVLDAVRLFDQVLQDEEDRIDPQWLEDNLPKRVRPKAPQFKGF